MADPRGFLAISRKGPARRPVAERLGDWQEVYEPFGRSALRAQATRCMDCGIPFCHEGCPLGNLIPEWNDLVRRGEMGRAASRLAVTNNFPELTGRLCPAPCEGSCVLGLSGEPVLIKQVELEIAEHAARSGSLVPVRPASSSGRSVAVVGSGPAGLAAAQQLTRAGHRVVVFERAEAPGGLLRYGIPEFKLEKWVVDRRIAQMTAEGTRFRTGVIVGEASAPDDSPPGAAAPAARRISAGELLEEFDLLLAAGGATRPRDLQVPGRQLAGVHFAMDYLKPANLACEARASSPVSAAGRDVVIIGGGDTGADCLGTAHRQGARSVRQLEIMPAPPLERRADNPWPTWPLILRSSAAHEEGGERLFAVETTELLGDEEGRVRAIRLRRLDGAGEAGPTLELRADLVLLALGFSGPERSGLTAELGLELAPAGTVAVDGEFATSHPRVYSCGDMARGQSLVVWAIAEGRSAAAAIDRRLGGAGLLPAPVRAGQAPLR